MNAPEEIKEGDIVYLKTGSSAMIADKIDGEDVLCIWHFKGEHREHKYSIKHLTKVNPDDDFPLGGISKG